MNSRKVSASVKRFCEAHVAMLWDVMTATGNGYRRNSLRHTGDYSFNDDGEIVWDRRADKIEEPDRSAARYSARYASPAITGKPHRRG